MELPEVGRANMIIARIEPATVQDPMNILIVEDHADIRRLIRMTLELEECQVDEAPTADAGLVSIEQRMPDLVLMDIMMPGTLDGLVLCKAIKSNPAREHVKVVLLSARGGSADREAGLAAGADAYLVKPFSPMELLALVNQHRVEAA